MSVPPPPEVVETLVPDGVDVLFSPVSSPAIDGPRHNASEMVFQVMGGTDFRHPAEGVVPGFRTADWLQS